MNARLLLAVVLAATASATGLAASSPTAVRYVFSDRYDLDIWTGPSSGPIQAYGGNGGTIDVSVTRNASGTFDVRQAMSDVNGSGTLDSRYVLVREGRRMQEALAAQAETRRSSGVEQWMTYSYPTPRVAFVLPLTAHDGWSAATLEVVSASTVQTSPSPYREFETADRAGDGSYVAQDTASDFASATHVRLFSASTYELSEPAKGYNRLTQTFALPVDGDIDVTSSGEPPLPVKPGTVKIKSWYPYNGGALTQPLQRDRFRVAGTATIPRACGRRAHQPGMRVNEDGYAVDPVRGTARAFVAAYFLTPLTTGTLLVACVEEQYVEGMWANGWAMSAGSWGKLTLEQSGFRLYVARNVSIGAAGTARLAGLPVVGFDAIAVRRVLDRVP